jgi:hypothetical protein
MKTYKVKRKTIEIPNSWEDLNFKEKIFAFKILIRVLHGDLKDVPHFGLLKLLLKLTGYKPASIRYKRALHLTAYYFELFWIYILNFQFLIKYGWKDYREYIHLLKETRIRDPDMERYEMDIIDLGLLRIAEMTMTFVYKIDSEAKKIIPQYTFRKNPFPFIRIGQTKYTGKRFFINLTAVTDITARCFVDALDFLMLMDKVTTREERDECMNKICATLYPASRDHNENLLSGHDRQMKKLDPVIRFAIGYWFTGIVHWFRENDTYRVLFDRIKKDDAGSSEKISVGMNEIALFLRKEGYGDPNDMNLIDYFDAQVKSLKDYVSKAIADGVKPAVLSQKSGIPINYINQLS